LHWDSADLSVGLIHEVFACSTVHQGCGGTFLAFGSLDPYLDYNFFLWSYQIVYIWFAVFSSVTEFALRWQLLAPIPKGPCFPMVSLSGLLLLLLFPHMLLLLPYMVVGGYPSGAACSLERNIPLIILQTCIFRWHQGPLVLGQRGHFLCCSHCVVGYHGSHPWSTFCVPCLNIVQFVVNFDGLVGVFHDGFWFHWKHCQLSLCSFRKSCIEFVDVYQVVVVKIGNDKLEFGPVQCCGVGTLFDLIEPDFGDFLYIDFSLRSVDRAFEFFPCCDTTSSVRDQELNPFPDCSTASAVGIVEFLTLVRKSV